MSDPSGSAPEGPPSGAGPEGPPPVQGSPPVLGVPPSGPAPVPPPYGQAAYPQAPYHHNPYGVPGYAHPAYGVLLRDPEARPGTVLAAGIITLVTTGIMLLLLAVVLFFLLAARADFMEGFGAEAGFSRSEADGWFAGILVALLVLIFWCVAAVVLGVLVLRRSNVARIALVVSSAVTALLSLLAIGSGISVVFLAAAIAVIVLLFTGGAGDWFRREHLYSPPQLPRL